MCGGIISRSSPWVPLIPSPMNRWVSIHPSDRHLREPLEQQRIIVFVAFIQIHLAPCFSEPILRQSILVGSVWWAPPVTSWWPGESVRQTLLGRGPSDLTPPSCIHLLKSLNYEWTDAPIRLESLQHSHLPAALSISALGHFRSKPRQPALGETPCSFAPCSFIVCSGICRARTPG